MGRASLGTGYPRSRFLYMPHDDEMVILRSLKRAQAVLGQYIHPGPRDEKRTLDQLLGILDRRRLHAAVDRRMRACGKLYRQARIEPRTVPIVPTNESFEEELAMDDVMKKTPL